MTKSTQRKIAEHDATTCHQHIRGLHIAMDALSKVKMVDSDEASTDDLARFKTARV